MAVKSVRGIDLNGKNAFCRVDFNVPLNESGMVLDDTRIKRSIPTIEYICSQGAKCILASHLGRPKGQRKPELSLRPVAEKLARLMGKEAAFADDCIGNAVEQALDGMEFGQVALLENVRFYEGETKNDEEFAGMLARNMDVYINDAFGTAHRAHASTVGITKHVKEKAAGLLLTQELDSLKKAFDNPDRPIIGIFGGAKVSDKLGVLKNLADKFDRFLIGGGMANTFLKAAGYAVGASKVEEDLLEDAKELLKGGQGSESKILMPSDMIVADKMAIDAQTKQVQAGHVEDHELILDIGSRTVDLYRKMIESAGTIVWNGPMGVFEIEPFKMGTMMVTRAVTRSKVFSVAGGGDTVRALKQFGAEDSISYISTGGGAFMEYMEGKTLAGVAALEM